MKLIALAAVLAFGGTAVAQTTPAPQDSAQTADSTGVQTVDDPKGGYQPTAPLFSAPPQPGQQVIFQPNTQTPDQAYPAPPPLPSYPICKKGQFDNCRQRGG
jgi:hypothetical protein